MKVEFSLRGFEFSSTSHWGALLVWVLRNYLLCLRFSWPVLIVCTQVIKSAGWWGWRHQVNIKEFPLLPVVREVVCSVFAFFLEEALLFLLLYFYPSLRLLGIWYPHFLWGALCLLDSPPQASFLCMMHKTVLHITIDAVLDSVKVFNIW